MPSYESQSSTRILCSKPGEPIDRVSVSQYASDLLIAASSKSKIGNLHLWSLSYEAAENENTKPCESFSHDSRVLFMKGFPDGKMLVTLANGESIIYHLEVGDSGYKLSKLLSSKPFDVSPTERLEFNLSSPFSNLSDGECAYALIDSYSTGRISVLGMLSDQQPTVEIIQDFYYAPILGNLATSCAVRCSSTAGSPMLVVGDINGRLHFFDLRLSCVGAPIFTKAGAVKPITCIGLHPFSTETIAFGCEDGTMSMLDLRQVSKQTTSSAAGQTVFAAHTLPVNALTFNPAEPDQLFSVGCDGLLVEWIWANSMHGEGSEEDEVPKAEPILSLPGIPLNSLAIDTSHSFQGPVVVAGSDMGDIYVIN